MAEFASLLETPPPIPEGAKKRAVRRVSAAHASAEDIQRDIDGLQDKLLMDKLHPEEEKRLTKLIALRRGYNQERPATDDERKKDRVEMHRIMAKLGPMPTMPPNPDMEAVPVLVEEPKETKHRPDLGISGRERIMGKLTDEERMEVAKAKVERTLAPRRKALKDAQEEEAWIAARIENSYGKHPTALEIERSRVGSKLGRWFKRGLHSLMGEPSPDEMLVRDLAEWRAAAARVETLREQLGEMDKTGVGAARVAERQMRADAMRKRQAEGDREAAAQYRTEHDLMATGGNLESQERGFFDDNRSLEDIADEETFRARHKEEIERARQLFTEYAGNVPHDKKASGDHREYAAVLWNEVNGKLGRRSASAMERAARLMGTRDVATAYMLDLAKLAETAIEEAQDTREQITDLAESVQLTRELTEASERVRTLNRLLGWDEERNIRPREKLAAPRRQLKKAA